MKFYPWKKNDVLTVNKFGILEPIKDKAKIPNIILVPMLAFDKDKFRLGYGKGYYDRYLNKYIICKKHKESHTHIVNICAKYKKILETCNEKMNIIHYIVQYHDISGKAHGKDNLDNRG